MVLQDSLLIIDPFGYSDLKKSFLKIINDIKLIKNQNAIQISTKCLQR